MKFHTLILMILSVTFLPDYCIAQDHPVKIFAGAMVDIEKGILSHQVLLTIESKQIKQVQENAPRPEEENVIDLSDYTIIPGLIDCHTHLTTNHEIDPYTVDIAGYGILGVINAKSTLEAGFTTVRDLHAHFDVDVSLRDAINDGWIPGPRIFASGAGLSITGGHGAWANWMSPQFQLNVNKVTADGEVEVMKRTREKIKNKVDWIKIFATGGFSSYGTIPGASSYSIDEMRIAVREANNIGIKVAAHAHGSEGIINALKAGVHSIEHGSFIDQEGIDLMKQKNAFLSMDLLAAHFDLFERNYDLSKKQISSTAQEQYNDFTSRFKKAYDQGVQMVFGTDAGVYPHGRNAEQFDLMVKAGMSEIDAIKSATITAAKMLGIENKLGSIKEGKLADIIAVKGNPLLDIRILEKVAFVMKEGVVIKNEVLKN